MLTIAETYMQRCLDLAHLGAGRVAPNPMVGAVLVNEGRIIGEGYHDQYGQAHAEANCLASVDHQDEPFIKSSTLYVSLEPCTHFGKTPPCTDLIIEKRIPRVVIGCRDPNQVVKGKGIEKLIAAGLEVETAILEADCIRLNKRFFTFHSKHRPFIILKWAESADGKLANEDYSRVFLTNDFSNRLTHKWRAHESSVLIGTNTALYDNPSLNLRFWSGTDPMRLVLDRHLKLPLSLKIYSTSQPTIVFNYIKQQEVGNRIYKKINDDKDIIPSILDLLYELKIQSVIVEGGALTLQAFIDEGLWDEARVIASREICLGKGILSPALKAANLVSVKNLSSNRISCYVHRDK